MPGLLAMLANRVKKEPFNLGATLIFLNALVPMRMYGVGPSNTWKFEFRISGPAIADPKILRDLAEQGLEILRDEPLAGEMQTDWRQPVPRYNQERARWAVVSREDLANTTKRSFDGRPVGLYREQDDLLPIVLRWVEDERQNVDRLEILQIQASAGTDTIPLAQVTDGIDYEWEDYLINRRDRRRSGDQDKY